MTIFYHSVATYESEKGKGTEDVLKSHNQKGQPKYFNKEIKIGLGMERMPCGQIHANAVLL